MLGSMSFWIVSILALSTLIELVRLSNQIRDKIKRIDNIKEIYRLGLISYETINSQQRYLESQTLRLMQGQLSDSIDLMRAVLDHIAYRIVKENNLQVSDKSTQFPIYCQSKNDFKKFMKKHFPDLENKDIGLYSILESIQPYNKESWLKDFKEISNMVKHRIDEELEYVERNLICVGNVNTAQIADYTLQLDATLTYNTSSKGVFCKEIVITKNGILKTENNSYVGPRTITVSEVVSLQDPSLNTYTVKILFLKHSKKDFMPTIKMFILGFNNLLASLENIRTK